MSYDETDMKEQLNGVGEVFKPIMEEMKEQMNKGKRPRELSKEATEEKVIAQIGEPKIIVPPGGNAGLVGLDGRPLEDKQKKRQKEEMALLKAMLGGGDLEISGYTDKGDPIYKLTPQQAAKYKKIHRHQKHMKKKGRQQSEAMSGIDATERKKRTKKKKKAKASRKRNRRK